MVDSVLGFLGASKQASATESAARTTAAAQNRAAELQYEASLPWSVSGDGGGALFDEENKTGQYDLSPELQALYGSGLQRSGMWEQDIQQFIDDPYTAQQNLYQQQQALFAPQQERQRLGLENRLLQQGLFGQGQGEFGANPQMQALLEAQAADDRSRQWDSLNAVQKLTDLYLGRQTADVNQSTGLLDIPLQYANSGQGIGASLGGNTASATALRGQAAAGLGGATAAANSAPWNALTQMAPSIAANSPFTGGVGAGDIGSMVQGMFYGNDGGSFASTSNPNYWSPDNATTADFFAPY